MKRTSLNQLIVNTVLLWGLYSPLSLAGSIQLFAGSSGSATNSDTITFPTLSPFPNQANPVDFNPSVSMLLNFGDNASMQYNSIFIGEGVEITIAAADGATVELISTGDIDIAGSLSWLSGTLSLRSIEGDIKISGSLAADSLRLSSETIELPDTSNFSVAGLDLPNPNIEIPLTTSGTIILRNGPTILTTVPLPASIWLLFVGLFPIIKCFRYTKQDRSPNLC